MDASAHRPDHRDLEPLLELKGVEAEFMTADGPLKVLKGVSMTVGRGETVGVVGETGCGKSATLRAMLGLMAHPGRVTGGQALFEGTDLIQLSDKQLRHVRGGRIGFIAQQPWAALNPVLPLGEQFRNVIKAHRPKATKAEIAEMSVQILRAVHLPEPERLLKRYSYELSGGMAQRVVIALALVLNPDLVVADEPTTALDLTVQRQVLDLVRELVSGSGKSMMIVTHDLGVVAQYCDRVFVMYAGQVIESGPVSEVFRTPSHPYTQGLLAAMPGLDVPYAPLSGRVPTLADLGAGCAFAARCPHVQDLCRQERPDDQPRGDLRTSRCHFDEFPLEVGAR